MSPRTPIAIAILLLAGPPAAPAVAQTISLRLGVGAAATDGVGAAGLVGIEGRIGPVLVARLEARGTGPENIGMVSGGIALGVAARRENRFRPYALATVASALDLREADEATLAGVVAGADFGGKVGFFTELRYDHLWQKGSTYYDLPENHVTLLVGLRVGL